jgi:allantoinase
LEVSPHHLLFASEDVPSGATEFKCAPPLRAAPGRDALRAALGSGAIDTVGSDHSPAPPSLKALKQGDFIAAWGGISGLQYTLPAMNSLREVRLQRHRPESSWALMPHESPRLRGAGRMSHA